MWLSYPPSGHLGAVVGIALEDEGEAALRAGGRAGVAVVLPAGLNVEGQVIRMQFAVVLVAWDAADLFFIKRDEYIRRREWNNQTPYLVDGEALDAFVIAVAAE